MKTSSDTKHLLAVNSDKCSAESVIMTCNQTFNLNRLLYVVIVIAFFTFLFLSLLPLTGGQLPPLPTGPAGQYKSSSKLNLCQRCKILVESFDKVTMLYHYETYHDQLAQSTFEAMHLVSLLQVLNAQ